jgi:DNA uptake protein ComE-like DNA-binding protein
MLSDFVKKNWLTYLQRGRKFNLPEDVLKIYGMDSLWYGINKDSIVISTKIQSEKQQPVYSLFSFDPNTLSKQSFEKLGFAEWLAERIIKYRDAGGQFKKPEDLLKIYDFPEDLYKRVKPYIQIKSVESNETVEKEVVEEESLKVYDLNEVDSIQLISIKGIGPTFASRILDYRNKLGGYANIDQLTEVYGLDAERVEGFRGILNIQRDQINKLDINKATFKELVAHPYLKYDQVKVIVRYRETIGRINELRDLLNLEHFDEKDIERLTPYLSVE